MGLPFASSAQASPEHPGEVRHWPAPAELMMILGFWALLGALLVANRMLDPRAARLGSLVMPATLLPLAEVAIWALVTPVVFWITSRLSLEHGHRVMRILAFVAILVALAMLADAIMEIVRREILPIRRPRTGPGAFFGGEGGAPGTGRGGSFRRGGPTMFRPSLYTYLVTLGGIFIAGVARDLSRRYRLRQAEATRLQAQLVEARLDALRRQLDPHFLFNTLNAVSSLVERDPRGVRRMISRLSDLLRHSIEGAMDTEHTLERELDLLRRYLDIMEIRFQGQLQVTLDVEERARGALVPNMILQPIVENAIKHGTSSMDAGRVSIAARVDGDTTVLTVRDNGPGPGGEPGDASGGGIGIRNTLARLEQLYGTAGRLTLDRGADRGAIAEIRLPYHTRADLRVQAGGTE